MNQQVGANVESTSFFLEEARLQRTIAMSLLRSLIVLLIANFCFLNLSSSFSTVEADGKLEVVRENKNSEHLKDPVTDLKRLSSITANNEKRISDEVLDEGASAHLGTILSGIIDEGSRESSKASPIYDASPDEYLIESLAHGKRRLDGDNVAALASTGRLTNNLRFMEQKQRDDRMALNQAASRAYSRRQMMMQNSYNNANLLGRGRKNWPNQFETQNLNRRSMSNVNNGAHQQQQRQRNGKQTLVNRKSAKSLDNNMLMRANFRQQESRKRASKQLVNGKSSEESDDDDIFKDDERENQSSANNDDDAGSSDRRSDDDAESKDDDADEEEDDESGSSRASGKRAGSGAKRNRGGRGRKLKAASESHHDRDEIDERDSSAANDDGEEDSDSSNDIRRVAASPIENSIQSTTSRALQRPLAAGLMLANNNNHDDNNNNNLNHDSASGDDSDQSATQLKHSSVELQAAAGSHHGHHGHYYQHVEVPKKKAWKFGFKRGNHKHESKFLEHVKRTFTS